MSRRAFLKQSSLASLGILTSPLYSSAFSFKPNKDVIIGHNSHQYKVDMAWGNLNANVTPVKDCHEMVQDSKGRIVLLTNHTKNNVIIYDKSGKFISSWGTEFPGGHGLTLVKENGEDFLLITDYERHQVIKTTIDGKKVFEIDFPSETGLYERKEQFKPTETTVLPNGDFYVADGYGSQYITHYNHKGELLNIFGGKGTENGQFLNAHGICYDNRDKNNPSLLISARSMNILKRFDLKGNFLESIPVPGALICRPVIHKNDIYFAVLKSKNAPNSDSGFLLIMNEKNEVVSCPGATAPSYANGNLDELYQTVRLFQHPHDVCIDDDENMYVAQWNSGQTYPIKLTRV
ncbi:NHL repeat-containing protein [Aestuariibaculum sediminum]|uniref:6-bladed beta-propeller n=1 Tax=Aestuariibaculum sediminum TaxID=2770637 RepID=A0A8J6QHF2_9FLAO|nr:6-bladed beta-propeller [Aestuariibaculum sediminum]MBD0831909.1 6-bladed beta-propeller [Aestuariibaculum sediminum]